MEAYSTVNGGKEEGGGEVTPCAPKLDSDTHAITHALARSEVGRQIAVQSLLPWGVVGNIGRNKDRFTN